MRKPQIMSGSIDRSIKLWDTVKGCCINTITTMSSCKAIALTNDDKMLISGHIDGSIKIWDINKCDLIKEIKDLHSNVISSLETSPDCKWVLTNSRYTILR